MIDPDPMEALRICPVRAAGEEIDGAIEYVRSLVDMALDLGDLEWAAQASRTHRVLLAARDLGIGRRLRQEPGEERAAA
ncbi:hypothetical protein Lesp02_01940 [Lentzea sp. NBRC 105346]|uniref:hypothetical protein n=1 Tax=Lentzea sp. NBRC 105346 TaxID=3032205 RepID=UPI0024A12143|nr:hypothetical protein [Lentzea sp. NBRC 105346]GLZ28004.1 hypothetical protein Lesp02_01940 [Lentzea sp. NBRC 105346]